MEVMRSFHLVVGATFFASCSVMAIDVSNVKDVYVADFQSDDMKRCGPADVDLSHNEAHAFFMRAKQVDTRTLHDHYNYAPCYIEGTLTYKSESCEWEIRAGATGMIRCENKTWYFACDNCEDLFRTELKRDE